jgi:hypothetical protein
MPISRDRRLPARAGRGHHEGHEKHEGHKAREAFLNGSVAALAINVMKLNEGFKHSVLWPLRALRVLRGYHTIQPAKTRLAAYDRRLAQS